MAQRSPGWCSGTAQSNTWERAAPYRQGRGSHPGLEEERLAGRMQPVSCHLLSRPRNTSWPISLTGQWDCSSKETVLSCCGTTASAAPVSALKLVFFVDVIIETIQV